MTGRGAGDDNPSADAIDHISVDQIPLHSTNLLTVLDETGVVQYESPAIERIYGFDQDELVGEQVADYFHPEDREAVLVAFQRVVTSEAYTTEAVEYRHERADGSYCWVESVASSDSTPAGNYVVNTRDISERKAREQDLVRSNQRLEQFASVLSHDLRNPLQVARTRLEIERADRDSEHLAAIGRSIDRMETLIESLLAVTQDGEVVADVDPVDVEAVVADAWESVDTGSATLSVTTDRTVRADGPRLQQLFENLVGNAVQYGAADVHVEVGSLDDGFYVADDGRGIPEQERERVFERGYSGTEVGTGIGLSIVEGISHSHGWEVTVTDSEPGGARFEFTGVDRPDDE